MYIYIYIYTYTHIYVSKGAKKAAKKKGGEFDAEGLRG